MNLVDTLRKLFRIEKLSKRNNPSNVGDDLIQLAQAKGRSQTSLDQVVASWQPLPKPVEAKPNIPIMPLVRPGYDVTFTPLTLPATSNAQEAPIIGMTPLPLPELENMVVDADPQTEKEEVDPVQLEYIQKVTTRNTPIIFVGDNNEISLGLGSTIEDFTSGPTGPYQVEKIQLDEHGISGIRTAEARNPVIDSGDAASELIYSFTAPNGTKRRVRTTWVSDGVGSSAIGDYAAKILTSRAQEYVLSQVLNGRIKKNEEIQLIMAEAAADADQYFHSINIATFRAAYEKVLEGRGVSGIMASGMMKNFDEKAKADLKGKIKLASSTLLGLSVIDEPENANTPMETIYMDGGDGGFDVSAGWEYESYHSPTDYATGEAPEQIDWSTPVKDVDYYVGITSRRQFDRPPGTNFTVTLRSDGLDKLQINGHERTAEEMLRLAMEIKSYPDPISLLATLADQVPDDVTYFIIKS